MAGSAAKLHEPMFTPYDGEPSYEKWCAFEEKLYAYGCTADDHGWSYADVFRGVDAGGPAGPAIPAPAD